MNNLGISLNNRLRFTPNFEKQWRIYVEDYNVTGWAIWDESKHKEEPGDETDTLEAPDYSLANYTSDDPGMNSFVKLSAKFAEALKTVETAYEKSHSSLVRQRMETLRKYREKAQQDGDLDMVMLYDEAMKTEAPIETDNKALLALFSKFSADGEELKKTRDMKCVKLVAWLCSQIENIKVQETKAGNFKLAKEAKAYEERVKKLSDSLNSHIKFLEKNAPVSSIPAANGPSRPQPRQAGNSEGKDAPPTSSELFSVPGAMTYRVFVSANDEKGALIGGGSFEKGDLLIIQYMGGEMSRYKGSSYSTNPDKQDSYYYYDDEYVRSRTHSFVKVEGPTGSRTKISRQLPYGTAKSPYVFEVPESGRYRLIGYLSSSGDGKVSYQVLRVTKFNSQTFRSSSQAKRCQW